MSADNLQFLLDVFGLSLSYYAVITYRTWREFYFAGALLLAFAFVLAGDFATAFRSQAFSVFLDPIRPFIFRPVLIAGLILGLAGRDWRTYFRI